MCSVTESGYWGSGEKSLRDVSFWDEQSDCSSDLKLRVSSRARRTGLHPRRFRSALRRLAAPLPLCLLPGLASTPETRRVLTVSHSPALERSGFWLLSNSENFWNVGLILVRTRSAGRQEGSPRCPWAVRYLEFFKLFLFQVQLAWSSLRGTA